jgi:FKBP-type peptidyl-prolyl cis-trans isomerase FkpA
MKTKFMFLALAAIALASCNAGFKKGEAGLLYNIVVDKDGPTIKDGDFLSVEAIEKTDADSVLLNTYEQGHPALMLMQPGHGKGDVTSAIKFLSEGDSAIVKVNIDSIAVKGQQRPPIKGKYIVFYLKVDKVIAKGNLNDQVFKGRIDDYVKSLTEQIKKHEPMAINKYVTDNKLKLTTTPSGLGYVITKQGDGPKPAPGDTVAVYYTGRFLTGKVFETNVKDVAVKEKLQINPMNPYKPIRFPIGAPGMIAGWNEAIPMLNKGSKATLVLPSSLAYGAQGNQMIPGFTPLVFEVELVDVIHPDPNAPKPVAQVPPAQAPKPMKIK